MLKVTSPIDYADRCSFETRFYISSAALDIDRLANAAPGHWGVESMHGLLDVKFKDDLSRYGSGHRPKNMAIVRHFARPRPRQRIQTKRQNPEDHQPAVTRAIFLSSSS